MELSNLAMDLAPPGGLQRRRGVSPPTSARSTSSASSSGVRCPGVEFRRIGAPTPRILVAEGKYEVHIGRVAHEAHQHPAGGAAPAPRARKSAAAGRHQAGARMSQPSSPSILPQLGANDRQSRGRASTQLSPDVRRPACNHVHPGDLDPHDAHDMGSLGSPSSRTTPSSDGIHEDANSPYDKVETETVSTSPLGQSTLSDSISGTSFAEGVPERALTISPDEFVAGITAAIVPQQLVEAHASTDVDLGPKYAAAPERSDAAVGEPRASSFIPPSNRNMRRGASGAPLGYQRAAAAAAHKSHAGTRKA